MGRMQTLLGPRSDPKRWLVGSLVALVLLAGVSTALARTLVSSYYGASLKVYISALASGESDRALPSFRLTPIIHRAPSP